jgi:hypothetical protein
VKAWSKAEWPAINYALSLLPWDLLESGSPEEALDIFYDLVHGVTADFVPSRRVSKKKPLWLSGETALALQNKRAAWKLWKSFPNPHTYATFSHLRRLSRNLLRRDYDNSIKSISDDLIVNPKRFWSLFNSRRKSARLPSIIKSDLGHFSGAARPSAFNSYFASNFTLPNPQIVLPTLLPVCPHSLSTISVLPQEILSLLKSLPPNKATGADALGSLFLHRTADSIHIPLCKLFNRFFASGSFPLDWKRALVTPILKSGPKEEVSNYRPISILPVLSILFERIIHDRLLSFTIPYISPHQHGFLPGGSCATNLTVLHHHITAAFEASSQLDVCYIDFAKAFDSINHALLIHKLANRYNINGPFLSLLANFLTDRTQRVVLDGATSQSLPITSGVPQGSVLGPLLFALFIDDISSVALSNSCEILLYADDCKIYKRISDVCDSQSLQQSLNSLETWCSQWKLKINPLKSRYISFSLKPKAIPNNYTLFNESIPIASSHNDLGVTFDSKLTFIPHINKIKSKAMSVVGMLYRFTSVTNPVALKTIFTGCVLPILDYCSIIYSTACRSSLKALDRPLNFFLSVVRHRVPPLRNSSRSEIMSALSITPLSTRRSISDLSFLHTAINGHFRSSEILPYFSFHIPARPLRKNHLLHLPKFRLSLSQRSFSYRLPKLYNTISSSRPSLDLSTPLRTFSNHLKECFSNTS